MRLKEAQSLLKSFHIEYTGNGDVIKSMTPEAGSKIPEGSTVRFMLGNLQLICKCDKIILVLALKYAIMYL